MVPLPVPQITAPRETLADLCRRWKINRLSLFGSVVRDDFAPDSDIDVLVEFEPGEAPGLIALSALQTELELLFGEHPVDLVTPGFLHHELRERIRKEAVLQYAA